MHRAGRPAGEYRVDNDCVPDLRPEFQETQRVASDFMHLNASRRVGSKFANRKNAGGIISPVDMPATEDGGVFHVRSISIFRKCVAQEMQGS